MNVRNVMLILTVDLSPKISENITRHLIGGVDVLVFLMVIVSLHGSVLTVDTSGLVRKND